MAEFIFINGLLHGNPVQLGIQLKAVPATMAYSFIVSFVLLKLVNLICELRTSEENERIGLDLTEHREVGYTLLD